GRHLRTVDRSNSGSRVLVACHLLGVRLARRRVRKRAADATVRVHDFEAKEAEIRRIGDAYRFALLWRSRSTFTRRIKEIIRGDLRAVIKRVIRGETIVYGKDSTGVKILLGEAELQWEWTA